MWSLMKSGQWLFHRQIEFGDVYELIMLALNAGVSQDHQYQSLYAVLIAPDPMTNEIYRSFAELRWNPSYIGLASCPT